MKKQASPEVTAAILAAVDDQLRDLNPPEAKETYDRLTSSGISDKEARRLLTVAPGRLHLILRSKLPDIR